MPAIRSAVLLRVLASALTLFSFGAMTSFAAGNLYQAKAPLQPSAPVSAPEVTPVPTIAPTARNSRTFVSPTVRTTTRTPTTRTRQSG